eukprot:m.639260 g.639260  ORF g.639260 m.639260 type:complete len:945 (+) comp22612_c0_seq6:177-3011(+)
MHISVQWVACVLIEHRLHESNTQHHPFEPIMPLDGKHTNVHDTAPERDDEWWALRAVEVLQVVQQHFSIEAAHVDSCTGTEAASSVSQHGDEIPASLLEMTRAACVHPGARVTLSTAPNLISHLSMMVSSGCDAGDLGKCSGGAATMLQCILYYTGRHESTVIPHVERLCSVLIQRISTLGSGSGGMPFLELLATLCREHHRARDAVKRSASAKKFYRHLVSLLDGDNLSAVVHALSLLTSLLINEDLGQKLFNPQNIEQTLQMAINLMQDAFPAAVSSATQARSLEATWLFAHSIDLMVDIVSHSSDVARHSLQRSAHVARAVVFAMDPTVHRQCSYSMRSKLAQLLWTLCWSATSDASSMSFPFRALVVNHIADSGDWFSSMLQFALRTLAPGSTLLDAHTDDVSAHAAVGVVGAILAQTAHAHAHPSPAGKAVVAAVTDLLAKVESTVAAYTVLHPSEQADAGIAAPLLALVALVLDGCTTLWARAQFVHLAEKLAALLTTLLTVQPHASQQAHVMMVLASWRLLSILRQTDMHATFLDRCALDRRHAMFEVVALGLASTAFANVTLAIHASESLTATSQAHEVTALRAQSIAAAATFAMVNTMSCAAHTARSHKYTTTALTQQNTSERQNVRDTRGNSDILDSRLSASQASHRTLLPGDASSGGAEATAVVARLMQGLRLKDLKSSELLNIYESKFRDMEAREEQLHALLDSKSQSLAQADSLVSEFRTKQMRMNKEFETLRAHLQAAELKSEASCSELTTVQGLHRQLSERCADLEAQIRRMKENLASKELHNTQMTEQLVLERHARNATEQEYESVATRCQALEVENETLSDRCTATTTLCVDLRTSVQELSTTVSKREADLQSLNEQYEALSAKSAWIEDEKMQVEEHCQELDKRLRQKQSDLDNLQRKHAELHDYVKRQTQLLATIQNLSMNAPAQ